VTDREPLMALMDAFHAGEEGWDRALSVETRTRVVARFCRILLERELRSAVDAPGTASDGEFRDGLARRWREDPDGLRRWIGTELGLRGWSFSARANQLHMVFRDAVYDGDVDHRL